MSAAEIQARRASDVLEELCNTKHQTLETRLGKVEDAVLKLQNRLPVWATVVMTIMGTIIGNLVGRMV